MFIVIVFNNYIICKKLNVFFKKWDVFSFRFSKDGFKYLEFINRKKLVRVRSYNSDCFFIGIF